MIRSLAIMAAVRVVGAGVWVVGRFSEVVWGR